MGISAVSDTRQQVDSGMVFQNRAFRALKQQRSSESIPSEIFKLWRWSFLKKFEKICVDCENGIKSWENVSRFWDNRVWTRCRNFSEIMTRIYVIGSVTCYETVLRFQIWLTEILSKSMCLRLLEIEDKSGTMVISAVFNTRQHVPCGRVF